MGRKRKNLVGKKFNRLTVLEYSHTRPRGMTYWKCMCDCGKEIITRGSELKYGGAKSCGCLRKENQLKSVILPNNGAYWNRIYHTYREGAKKRNLIFNLAVEDVKNLCLNVCTYCGAHPQLSVLNRKNSTPLKEYRNGIDRKNNSIGYEKSNIITCCSKCNAAKGIMSNKEFLLLCKKVTNNYQINLEDKK